MAHCCGTLPHSCLRGPWVAAPRSPSVCSPLPLAAGGHSRQITARLQPMHAALEAICCAQLHRAPCMHARLGAPGISRQCPSQPAHAPRRRVFAARRATAAACGVRPGGGGSSAAAHDDAAGAQHEETEQPGPSGRPAAPPAVVILVEPRRGENIGAAARGMKNFGLRELRIVNPVDGWPNERARAVAARAGDVIEQAKVYGTLDEALSDLQYVYAASGRPRDQDKLAKDVVMLRNVQDALPPAGTRIGIMFGREDNGLYNDELVRANAILTIDTDPSFYSLNLGQAVLIVCYELFRAPRRPELGAKRDPVTRHEVEGMLRRLFGSLEVRRFFNDYNRSVLQYAIRGFFDRVKDFSRQDVAAVNQMLKAMQRSPAPAAPQPEAEEGGAADGDAPEPPNGVAAAREPVAAGLGTRTEEGQRPV